ncbi:hypothetical protein [Mycoplasmopsis bovis]|uniref:hypothetical protein n=1 Tax=Mycoplasmopsis bovis TaxID=28903 RepID=UPI00244EC801|nr:hypothetical protein [Mycoplasmopsis bovis]
MGKINIGKIYKLKTNNNATFVIKGDDILEHKATFAKSDRAFVFFTNADVVYFFSSMPVNINNETQTLMDLFNQVNKDSSIYTEETIESFAKLYNVCNETWCIWYLFWSLRRRKGTIHTTASLRCCNEIYE